MTARLPDGICDAAGRSPVATPLRLTASPELGGSLQVTVESRHLLAVRRAIHRCGCKSLGIVRASRIAGGTRMRMLVALRLEDVARVRKAIENEVSLYQQRKPLT